MPDGHLLFYSQNIYFIGVHELIPLCGIRFLDEKSKQKNQEKIILAFTHKSRCTSGSRPFFRATALYSFLILDSLGVKR